MKITRNSAKSFYNTSPLGGVSHVSAISSRLSQDFYEACHTKYNSRWFSSKKDERGNSSHNPSLGVKDKVKFIKPEGDNCFKKIFNKKNLLKHFTVDKVLMGLSLLSISMIVKFSGLAEFILAFVCLSSPDEWAVWFTSGVIALFVKLPARGIIEALLDEIRSSFLPRVLFDSRWWIRRYIWRSEKVIIHESRSVSSGNNNSSSSGGSFTLDNRSQINSSSDGRIPFLVATPSLGGNLENSSTDAPTHPDSIGWRLPSFYSPVSISSSVVPATLQGDGDGDGDSLRSLSPDPSISHVSETSVADSLQNPARYVPSNISGVPTHYSGVPSPFNRIPPSGQRQISPNPWVWTHAHSFNPTGSLQRDSLPNPITNPATHSPLPSYSQISTTNTNISWPSNTSSLSNFRNLRSDAPSPSFHAVDSPEQSTVLNTPTPALTNPSLVSTQLINTHPALYASAINNEQPPANNDLLNPPVGTRSGLGYRWNNFTERFIVDDPNNLGARGYINPATGQPYPGSFQPYAGNLSRVMDAHRIHIGAMQFGNFLDVDRNFIYQVIKHKYPNRTVIWNSKANSKLIKNLD